jgi:hypothetical protein
MCEARRPEARETRRDSKSALDPGRGDWPVENAQSYVRSAILNDPDVIEHLLSLRDLRDEHGRFGLPYLSTLHNPVLLEQFTAGYLDMRIAVIRERLELLDGRFWREAIPVGDMGAGYGRERGAYPAMSPEAIELAVADFVRRLTGREHPALDPVTGKLPSTVRQYRRRLRKLATS